ncbi:LysR family transcriptional regulator [Verticiella sediminum]|uniref:LysR family transcriptional regulator n=1 Tax=Verticiella sediminum TaxID=1247510 RepID=A0A556AWN6_9BURK|nr:LysR family transcriptional regulator [Verticiella sediminum]TSH97326.1 LysR family transcriptional regulator [Verticiella sediminum]
MARLDQLRLRDLMVLETIADVGSLHATAAALHISQPAVSQIVKGLEAAMGAALLQRGRRGVSLTAAGAAALSHLRVARHALEAAQHAARQPEAPMLRLGALPLAMLELVPRAVARLRRRIPEVRIHMVDGAVDGLWRQLREGRLDAIVGRFPLAADRRDLPQTMHCQPIAREDLVLVAPARHAVTRLRTPSLQALAAQAWVLPPENSFTRRAFDVRFLEAGLAPPEPALVCSAFHGGLHLAAANALLTVAPRSAVTRYAPALDLKIIRLPWPDQDSDVVFACRRAGLVVPALAALRDSFQSRAPAP